MTPAPSPTVVGQVGNLRPIVKRPSGNPKSGYALLFVLMMAAVVAIMLYRQLPRVAFESQRDREQLLIDRGEQYKRAIQLYVRKFNRFPPDMQALENTQNIRFLRKQYTDPMTGKNEWRLIHVGPAGQLTDSLINKGGTQNKDTFGGPQTFITELQGLGGSQTNTQGVNQANRRRPSDDPGAPGAAGAPGDPNNPGTGFTGGPVMVLPDGRIVPATPTGIPASTGTTGSLTATLPGQPGFGQVAGQPGQPVQPGQLPSGFQTTPNSPNAPPANAANLINQILTTPRPGGLNGTGGYQPGGDNSAGTAATAGIGAAPVNNTGTPITGGMGGTTIGGGIAGVASKMEQEGIKVYNDQTEYNKWEFVYDMSKDRSRTGGAMPQQPPNPAANPSNNPAASPFGTPSTPGVGVQPPSPQTSPATTGTGN